MVEIYRNETKRIKIYFNGNEILFVNISTCLRYDDANHSTEHRTRAKAFLYVHFPLEKLHIAHDIFAEIKRKKRKKWKEKRKCSDFFVLIFTWQNIPHFSHPVCLHCRNSRRYNVAFHTFAVASTTMLTPLTTLMSLC